MADSQATNVIEAGNLIKGLHPDGQKRKLKQNQSKISSGSGEKNVINRTIESMFHTDKYMTAQCIRICGSFLYSYII